MKYRIVYPGIPALGIMAGIVAFVYIGCNQSKPELKTFNRYFSSIERYGVEIQQNVFEDGTESTYVILKSDEPGTYKEILGQYVHDEEGETYFYFLKLCRRDIDACAFVSFPGTEHQVVTTAWPDAGPSQLDVHLAFRTLENARKYGMAPEDVGTKQKKLGPVNPSPIPPRGSGVPI
jgi:hypothetical protein